MGSSRFPVYIYAGELRALGGMYQSVRTGFRNQGNDPKEFSVHIFHAHVNGYHNVMDSPFCSTKDTGN